MTLCECVCVTDEMQPYDAKHACKVCLDSYTEKLYLCGCACETACCHDRHYCEVESISVELPIYHC